jgi:hypothetical protein
MNDLFRLYNDVFSKLPVSLVGYDNIEERINSFFYKLKSDSYFKKYDNIAFFSYSLSKLKNAKNWETDQLSHEFFFDAYKKKNSLLTLSFYTYLKSQYLIKYNTITSLSELFAKDVSFRVSCTDNEKWNFYYDQSKNILSFEIPNCILKTNTYKDIERRFFKELIKHGALENYYVKQHDSLYKRVDPREIQNIIIDEHESFFQEGFNSYKIGTFDKKSAIYQKEGTLFYELYTELKYFTLLNPDLFVESTSTRPELIEEWISQLVSIAFLAGYYDCWIEYMPAVVGVFDLKKDGRVYKTEERNLGSFIIGYSKENEISLDDRAIFKLISERVSLAVGGVHFIELMKENEKHATHAAISQVMARNMSHNIGSHVLSNMVTEVSVESHFPKKQYKSSYDDSLYSDKAKTIEKNEWKLANFNSYLRTRMDFLADIATGQPAMEVTRNLVRDVMGEMDKNRILLNHISGVDNFEFSIVVKDCRECKLAHCSNHECGCDGKEKDNPVSIPNGIMGYHALYILIENIIRNTAKHQGSTSTLEKRIFTLEIRDSKIDNTLYEVLLYDNVPIGGDLIVDKDFFKKYAEKEYISEENKFLTHLDWLVFQQNCRLNTSVINPSTSRLREGAWGLIEMEASAAYLRKLSPETIDEDIYNLNVLEEEDRGKKEHLNILKAVKKGEHLAYRFHLMKPKELIVVDEVGALYNELRLTKNGVKSNYDNLLENGILVMQTANPYEDNFFDINSVYAHPFMLIIAGVKFSINNYLYTEVKNNNEKGLFRGNLPTRIIVCKDENTQAEKEETPWVTYIDCSHELMEVLREAKDLIRVIPKSKDDLNKQTLMDRVWQVWLENKIEFHNISINSREASPIELLINYYILKSGDNVNPFKIFLALHGKDINKRGQYDHFLAYPSSVKSFIESATQDLLLNNDTNELTANVLFDKISLSILIDSFLTRILVIDERVQMAWEQNYHSSEIKQQDLYECGGLFSPIKTNIDLSKQTYIVENESKPYEELIEDYIDVISKNKGNLKGLDCIVIHLGVIEKILTANKSPKKKENVRDFIIMLQNKLDSKTRIVITSGRGKPDNLPEQVPFVSFSTLSQYTIETPFKPFLNQILQNARTFKN